MGPLVLEKSSGGPQTQQDSGKVDKKHLKLDINSKEKLTNLPKEPDKHTRCADNGERIRKALDP
jgi:hypothetical protein